MINGRQLVEHSVITNVPEECIQQVGVDLQLIAIEKVDAGLYTGVIFKDPSKKTRLAEYKKIVHHQDSDGDFWHLTPGVYSLTFAQGCNIPENLFTLIRQRSSLLRNGVFLHSSVFDPGFKTDNIGTCMVVIEPITIEVGARIAQMYGHAVNKVDNLYQGQWQEDNQRK